MACHALASEAHGRHREGVRHGSSLDASETSTGYIEQTRPDTKLSTPKWAMKRMALAKALHAY